MTDYREDHTVASKGKIKNDGSFESTESQRTVVEDDYYHSRYPDLAGDPSARRPVISRRRKQQQQQQQEQQQQQQQQQERQRQQQPTPSSTPPRLQCQPAAPLAFPVTPLSSLSLETTRHCETKMTELSQPQTQQATQPYENHRRFGRNLSDVSEDDAIDVICLLHPNSPLAFEASKATMLHGPQHILQNDDLDGITEEDMMFNQDLQVPREFALRTSSTVRRPVDGFRFGRNPALCDILLTNNAHDRLISNVHFKIFVNNQGSLMVQDLSTNGTIVDDELLRKRDLAPGQQPMRALKNGAIICVLAEPGKTEIKLMIRIPNRGDNEEAYENKLKQYLEQRGNVPVLASMRERTFGNHWNGGALYNFTGHLGKGAFATVYRIQTKREGTIYAAKELDKRRFIKNGVLDIKFDSELKIMKDLKHPNIVEYVDYQQYNHWVYIIMEFIPCGELSKDLQERKFIPEPEVQQIAKQIMHALDYLHRRNITHRDIKPDNILIASRDPLIVKLSDFGLSKCIKDQETFLKTFCGTLLYCAPEVYPDYNSYTSGPTKRRRRGDPAPKTSPYDQSVDMWSFGAVLFHILCGKPPIIGSGDQRGQQMLSNIMTRDVDFSPLRDQRVSGAGIDFIARLLNKNPLLRPSEGECLKHEWIKDLPDVCDYNEDDQIPAYLIRRELDAVEELDEDYVDEELLQDLNQLTKQPSPSDRGNTLSPEHRVKRPRTASDSMTIPAAVAYPHLPESSPTKLSTPVHGQGPRLFGEISPSILESSGIFGTQSPAVKGGDVPDIRTAIEQVSVNDYASRVRAINNQAVDEPRDSMQYPQALKVPEDQNYAAPSLLGAEAQIGQLNMASPEADPSDAPTPDTTHPITPRTREISPSSSVSRAMDKVSSHTSTNELKFSRKIDVNLLNDEAAFAASVQARDASRAEKRRQKAELSQAPPMTITRRFSTEPAATIDPRTETRASNVTRSGAVLPFSRTINLPSAANRSLSQLGKLTPVPGSCGEQQVIPLEGRMTSWGRGADCTIQYPNLKDTRVPKYAIKITFWAQGLEKAVEQGKDWKQVPGIRTLISTSTSHQIWVNDIELRKESADGKAALYGKLYTGDIITVHYGGEPYEFLKYHVEITFGDSARVRPEKERPFLTSKEMHHHRVQKERESVRDSRSDTSRNEPRAMTVASA